MTPIYCAPELLIQGRYSKKADIWAIGCIFFEQLMVCVDRRRTFRSISAITSYYYDETIPPPQISWKTIGTSPNFIPKVRMIYQTAVEKQWDQFNIILAAIFRRKPEERPNAVTIRDNLRLLREGKALTLPDFRPASK